MKRVATAPSFRSERIAAAIEAEIGRAVRRGVRVLHHSIQHDHLHMMVEATDKRTLARGMQLLFSRIAFAVNRIAKRGGSLFRDRHHRHELKTPTETRRCLVYVMFNSRKHDAQRGMLYDEDLESLDRFSSALWFDDWDPRARPPPDRLSRLRAASGPCPVAQPETWLAKHGYKRAGGAIRLDELPR